MLQAAHFFIQCILQNNLWNIGNCINNFKKDIKGKKGNLFVPICVLPAVNMVDVWVSLGQRMS